MTAVAVPASSIAIGTAAEDPVESAESAEALIQWSQLDPSFWVANSIGTHRGRVEADERGRFHAFSAHGIQLGSSPTLAAAQLAVERQRDPQLVGRRQRVLVVVTAVAGAAAVVMAAIAVVVTAV